MTRLLLRRLLDRMTGDGGEDADDGSGDASDDADGHNGEDGFAGSLLDWSVNYGHGPDGGRQEGARELAQMQEKAEMLDEQDRHRR